MTRTGLALGLVLVSIAAAPASGQVWQVDLSGAAARYDTGAYSSSAALSPQIEWSGGRALAVLGGSLAALEASQWTSQVRADGWLFRTATGRSPLGASLSAGMSGSVHSSGYRTGATRAEGRLLLGRGSSGAWLGAAGGTGWTSVVSSGFAGAWGPTGGFWIARRGWTGSITVRPFRFQQSWFPEANGSVVLTGPRADFAAFAGWRGAPAASGVSSMAWAGASLAVRVSPRVALIASGGSYPAEFLQALPRGRYVSVGVRVANRFRPPVPREPAAVYLPESQGAGRQLLRFTVPGAARVEAVGDWTGWAAVPLLREAGGQWTLRVTLPPGVYRFNLVVDGSRWIVPPEVGAVDDGLGGKTGLLVVP